MNYKAFLVLMVYCVHAIKYDSLSSAMMEPNYANTTDNVESFGAILNEMVSQSMAGSGCWSKKLLGKYVQQQHGKTNECYSFAVAKTKCEAAKDCGAIATQSNVCGGKYRVTHGGPNLISYGNWKPYNLHAYTFSRKANCAPATTAAPEGIDLAKYSRTWGICKERKSDTPHFPGSAKEDIATQCGTYCKNKYPDSPGFAHACPKCGAPNCRCCDGDGKETSGAGGWDTYFLPQEEGKGKKHGDIFDLLIKMKASIKEELKSTTTTANRRCTSDTTKKDMTREKDFGCGTMYLDLVGCTSASECEKSTEKQQNLAVAAYKAIVLLKAKNAVLEEEMGTFGKCETDGGKAIAVLVKKKTKNTNDHLARMNKFNQAIAKLGLIDSYLDENTGKIGKAMLLSEEEKNVIENFKVGKAMLLLLDQAMTGAKEKELVKTLKKLLASCIKSLKASKVREQAAHKNWMKELDAEIKAKKDAVARCIKKKGDVAGKIAANTKLIKAEEKKKTNALATSKTERESCLNAHKDFVESLKDFNLEINAIDEMIKILKKANLDANTAVIRNETEKTKHGVKESLEVSQCGSPPKGQVFLAAKTAKSWCAAAPCKKAECFEDVGKCGSPPKGQVFLAAKVSSSTCAAATCKKAECFEDVGKCGSPPTGQVFKSGKGSTSTCAAATCKKAECFQNAAKCGSPPRGQVFKRGKGSNSICAGATCRNGECFQKKTYPVCGNVYEHYGKGGWKVAVRNGENDTFFSHANDKASAVRVTAGCKLLLWEHAHYKGAVRTYDNRNGNAARDWNLSGFNDIMSSLKCSCI